MHRRQRLPMNILITLTKTKKPDCMESNIKTRL